MGDPGAPVRLAPDLRGAVPDLRGDLVIVGISKINRCPTTLETLARAAAVRVVRGDAAEFVERVLTKPSRGMVTVIFHTIVWQYLSEPTRSRIRAALESAADRPADAPAAWVRFEGVGGAPPAKVIVTTWPGKQETVLAEGDFHGRWLDWSEPRAED